MSIPRKESDKAPPIHPGEFLREDFMKPLEMTSTPLAAALKAPVRQISAVVNERKRMTAEIAMRLERYWGMPADFWMRVQMQYDLETAKDSSLATIRRQVRPAPRDRKTGALLKRQTTA